MKSRTFFLLFVALLGIVCIRVFIVTVFHASSGSAEPTILIGDRFLVEKISILVRDPEPGDIIAFDDPQFVFSPDFFKRFWQQLIGIRMPLLGLPEGPTLLVKRVIAVPGDTIEGRIDPISGAPKLYRNGTELVEPYVNRFPLVQVRRTAGLISPRAAYAQLFPKPFLLHDIVMRLSFDPSRLPEEQELYLMDQSEIVLHPYTEKPLLTHPGEPNYTRSGKCVDVFGPITLDADSYWVHGDNRRNSRDSRYWSHFVKREHIRGKVALLLFSLDTPEEFLILSLLRNPWKFFTRQVRWGRLLRALR